MDITMCVILFVLLLFFFVFIIIVCRMAGKNEKKETDKSQSENNYTNEFDTIEMHVRVVDIACTTRMVGVKYPKSIREYFVAFEKDDKSILKTSVPEEFYDGFEIGQVGILTLVDGNVYSFVPDHYAMENKNETNN